MLTHTFTSRSAQETEGFAKKLGFFVQNLYENRHCLQPDPGTEHQVMIVAVEGEPGAGKTEISKQLVLKNVGGEGSDDSSYALRFEGSNDGAHPERIVMVWQNFWSPETQQQNRIMDCQLTGPYRRQNDGLPNIPIAPRQYSGIEILEHPFDIPEEKRALTTTLDIQQDGSRLITVCLHDPNEKVQASWDDFVRDIS